jgi:hypothetical protein
MSAYPCGGPVNTLARNSLMLAMASSIASIVGMQRSKISGPLMSA